MPESEPTNVQHMEMYCRATRPGPAKYVELIMLARNLDRLQEEGEL
jgi:hypothetical protein